MCGLLQEVNRQITPTPSKHQERANNLSIFAVSGPGGFFRVESHEAAGRLSSLSLCVIVIVVVVCGFGCGCVG